MNLELLKTGVTKLAGSKALALQKHSPTIMVVAGTVGMVAAVVEASRATLKVEEILEAHNDKMEEIDTYIEASNEDGEIHLLEDDEPITINVEELEKDKRTLYLRTGARLAKNYAPTASLVVISGVLILSGYNVLNKRNAAYMAAYKALDESFRDYRKKVVEKYGEEIGRNLEYTTDKAKIPYKDEETGRKKTKTVDAFSDSAKASIYSRIFNGSNLEWQNNMNFNYDYIEAQERHLNNRLKARGHVFLNEALDAFGYKRTDVGSIAGWRLHGEGDGYITCNAKEIFQTVTALSGAEVPDKAILLSFNVDPGTIFDKL